jgi:hypothetical protein
MRSRTALVGAVALIATALTGAVEVGGAVAASRVQPSASAAAEGAADWTLMIYDVADTANIADEMIRNLAAFAELPEMPNVNVVALVDLPERGDPGAPTSRLPGMGDFTTAKLFKLEGGRYQELRDLGEVSMGRPDVLAGFIDEVADRFPARKYGLVLSDHGGAYSGGYVDTGPPGTTAMTVEDIRIGMLDGMQRAGIDRFEMVDHDSCLMSSYEVASALAPLAKTMVGSEEVTFGDNTLTSQAMQSLGEDVSGAAWGQTNIEAYAAALDSAPQGIGGFSALSVVDGDQMTRLDAAVESFADVAVAHMDEIAPQVGLARSKALEFVVGLLGSSESMNAIDLGDFLRNLQDVPPDVEVARDSVFAALDAAVVGQVTRPATAQATGLNVFFPSRSSDVGDYLDTHVGPPGWSRFVAAYLAASAGSGDDQAASFVSDQATVMEQGKGGIRIAGQLSQGQVANVTDTATLITTELDGRRVLAGLLPAYLNSGGEGMVQGVWDYGITTLTNGDTSVPASGVYQAQSGGLIGNLWAQYRSPDGEESDVVFRVLLSSEGEIESFTVSDASSDDASAGVDLEDGGSVTPYLILPLDAGFDMVASTQSIDVTPELRVDYPQMPANTRFDISVAVMDLAGNISESSVTATVPEGRTR